MAIIDRQGNYQVKVRDNIGRWFPSKTFIRKVDAERYQRDLEYKKDNGLMAQGDFKNDMIMDDYWALWSERCRNKASDGWKMTQNQIYRDYIQPFIGIRKINSLYSIDVEPIFNNLKKIGRSAQTIQHVYCILNKMFSDAIEYFEIIDRNPIKRRFKPVIPKKERAFLSPAESLALLEYARNDWQGVAIWICLLSGLRISEVQALRWKAVDFERNQILIEAAYNRKEGKLQAHPKQKDWGSAPMPPMLKEFLLEKSVGKTKDGFVAANPDGSMLNHSTFLDRLRVICKNANVQVVTPHELRHSCTEMYVQQGASAEDIRRLLNQKSLTSTARYMHRTDGRLSGIASKVGNLRKPEIIPFEQAI